MCGNKYKKITEVAPDGEGYETSDRQEWCNSFFQSTAYTPAPSIRESSPCDTRGHQAPTVTTPHAAPTTCSTSSTARRPRQPVITTIPLAGCTATPTKGVARRRTLSSNGGDPREFSRLSLHLTIFFLLTRQRCSSTKCSVTTLSLKRLS